MGVREGQRRSPSGEPMHRIPEDDEHRGMVEGLCLTCMCVTAEWRTEDGEWWECDDCADIDGEDPLNDVKRLANKTRAALRRDDLTPIARMVMQRVLGSTEAHLKAMRERFGAEADS